MTAINPYHIAFRHICLAGMIILVLWDLRAQPDSLFTLDDTEAIKLRQWYDQAAKNDTAAFLSGLKALEAHYKKSGRLYLRRKVWYCQIEFKASHENSFEDGNAIIREGARIAHERKWNETEGECLVNLGLRLAEAGKWGPAYEFMMKGHQLLIEYGYEHFPDTRNYLYLQGLFYMKSGEYERAARLLRKFCNYWSDPAIAKDGYHALNTLGLAYKNSGQLDSAAHFLQLTIQNARYHQNPVYTTLAQGNLGQTYFENKQFDAALPLLLEDYHESIRYNIPGSSSNAAITLARLYMQRNMLDSANYYIKIGKGVLAHTVLAPKAMYYETCFSIYKYQGDWKNAVLCADSMQILTDSLQRMQDASILQQAQRRVEVERHSAELNKLESARRRQITLRNSFLLAFAFAALLLIQYYQRIMMRRKRELELASLNEQIAKKALQEATRELDQYTRKLTEKNELIESIREEMEQLRSAGDHLMDERSQRLNEMLHHAILTESDWNEFRALFEKVHPGFFRNLKEKMPDLTPADTRLLAFTKLQLSTKEMASLLGISADSIKKSRQRLRRRVHLPEEGSLDELIADL